ncbi:MAG: phosphopyruvate hydratase [Methanosarcinales archaeon]|uniref:Enolase n=1 Tax=Candidatus Ethanoperedens thermophilum TaxID=2766897 RepID=A0A848DBS1_9EURY|nr:phosphopyruvate hydratase [Candidatus Ethanoperedens thermophilum]
MVKNMFSIEYIHAREILDSRGNPTVEVDVKTESTHGRSGFGRASIPSGASTGSNEALELRDGGERYNGKGVLKAVENINNVIRRELIGMDVRRQREIDQTMIELDGTPGKSILGANAILGVSLAVARTAANSLDLPLYQYLGGNNVFLLPVPTLNVLNGGKHAGNKLSIQEFMVQPKGAKSFREALQMAAETYHALGKILEKQYGKGSINVGYEGGYAPPLQNTADALDAVTKAIETAGYTNEVSIGLDSAANEFYKNGTYYIDGKNLTPAELADYYVELTKQYNIALLEDPFHEDAFENFAELTRRLSNTIIIGDDIFVTNTRLLAKGIEMGAANALLLKVNQIGSLSESFDAARMAHKNKYKVIVSHRSAETEDTSIADISVALGAELIKTGAPARSERTAKYNQLLRIEEELKSEAQYTKL